MYERHRPALRRQAARLLYASGHDPEDVLQDVFLRVHGALRSGVVPLEPRPWLLRLVHNACVDELRRARTRPLGDVELDGVPSIAPLLPDELARRAEARALLGDIHRLPDRQRSVLVMSAIEGLSHEEVAGRLSTTVETTRSLLARARENLRRTAAARETACHAVCDALDEAAAAGVRASEVARRHLWSCTDCRVYQRGLRAAPSRLRRLASWSPWGLLAQLVGGGGLASVQKVAVGACCALVVGGGAVAVPEIAVHTRHVPQVAAVVPQAVAPAPASHPKRKRARAVVPPAPTPGPVYASAPAAPVTTVTAVAKAKAKAERVRATTTALTRNELRRLSRVMRQFNLRNPTTAERVAMHGLVRGLQAQPVGSKQRTMALRRLKQKAFGAPKPLPVIRTGPPKGITAPASTPSPDARRRPPPRSRRRPPRPRRSHPRTWRSPPQPSRRVATARASSAVRGGGEAGDDRGRLDLDRQRRPGARGRGLGAGARRGRRRAGGALADHDDVAGPLALEVEPGDVAQRPCRVETGRRSPARVDRGDAGARRPSSGRATSTVLPLAPLTRHSVSMKSVSKRWVVRISAPPAREVPRTRRRWNGPANGYEPRVVRGPARRLEQLAAARRVCHRSLRGGGDPARAVADDDAEGRRRAPADAAGDVLLRRRTAARARARRTGTRRG